MRRTKYRGLPCTVPLRFLEASGNVVPVELARHEASRTKPLKGQDKFDAMGMRNITD